jgi:hypothetical protein
MPEISDADFQQFQRLQSQNVAMELDLAKANFKAAHPHIPQALVDAFQGSPEQIQQFGQALLQQFPVPQPPLSGGQPAPASPIPGGDSSPPSSVQPNQQPVTPPNPAVSAQQPELRPATPPHPASQTPQSTTPPIMAQPVNPVPDSPLAVQQRYQAQMAAVTPYSGGMQPVPQPGLAGQVDQHGARDAQAMQIRERMSSGIATKAEAEWLAQWGTKGFVSAMQSHAADVRQSVGGRSG